MATFSAGEISNEMGLRRTVTPDALLGRMNGTMRNANRTLAAVKALGDGALMTVARDSVALLAVTVVFTTAVTVAMCSPLLTATVRERIGYREAILGGTHLPEQG
jgi:hypothetical protein